MHNYNINNRPSPFKKNSDSSTFYKIVNLIAHKTNFAPRTYGKGYKMRCPAHEDKNPSLGISEGSDGMVLMYCYSGCTIESICESIGITIKDLFPQSSNLSSSLYKKQDRHRKTFSRRR